MLDTAQIATAAEPALVYHRAGGWPPSRLQPLALTTGEEALLSSRLKAFARLVRKPAR